MAGDGYDFKGIESKWQKYWEEIGLFRMNPGSPKPKYYCLMMFPYPSGSLHMGHVLNYTLGDAMVRFKIMQGFNVLTPMGWDSFGLPAENAAIKAKTHPRKLTFDNIRKMRNQIREAGWGYDWDREVATCEPDYYRWTQWIFLQMFKKGLAYRKEMPINWCPSCKTGLANEETAGGVCDRCGTPVTKKLLNQWMLKITHYAERLLKDLDSLDWPDRVKKMQANWIGRSEGAEIFFKVAGRDLEIKVFTTRADTLYGATFLVLAPEHPMVETLRTGGKAEDVEAYVERTLQRSAVDRMSEVNEKTGVFTGSYAVNPINGEKIPIWVSDYVLMEYGTGAIMCVPGHDGRDFQFAKKFNLPIRRVIAEDVSRAKEPLEEAYTGDGVMVNSGPFTGSPGPEGAREIARQLGEKGIGGPCVNYKLRDWIFSRQRYWGEPIPIVHCPNCGEVPVPEDQLPVMLPEIDHYEPTGTGESPLANVEEWVNASCPKCGGPGRRETNTMPQWAGSCWYFLRYVDPHNDKQPWDRKLADRWFPVDQYVGGIEHAVLHLLYSRFYVKFLYDIGAVGFEEPFEKLFNQGMVCKDGAKMSKSLGNVVYPDEIIPKLGADTLRLYVLFMGPPEKDSEWSSASVMGAHRFLNRLYDMVARDSPALEKIEPYAGAAEKLTPPTRAVYRKVHRTIAKVTDEMDKTFHYNTAIASIMELTNTLRDIPREGKENLGVLRFALESIVTLLSPIAAHISEELWERLGHKPSIFHQPWPQADARIAAAEMLEIAVQIKGKVRSRMTISAEATEEEVKSAALADPKIQQLLAGRDIMKIVVVPGRLVNIVDGA